MAKLDLKVMADEELARKLHEELNPESSPMAGIRRNRKAPSFYSPPVRSKMGGGDHPTSDDEKPTSSKRGSGKKGKLNEVKSEKAEMAASSPGSGRALTVKEDSTEGLTNGQGRPFKKQKLSDMTDALETRESHSLRDRPLTRQSVPLKESKFERDLHVRDSTSELGYSTDRSTKMEPVMRLTRSQIVEENQAANTQGNSQKGRAMPLRSEDLRARSSNIASESMSQGSGREKRKGERAIPKMPMCKHGPDGAYYRARKISEQKSKVQLEFPGLIGAQSLWLPKNSPRLWSGSLKTSAWRYLGDGAWEPKVAENAPRKRKGRGKRRKLPEQSQTVSSSGDEYSDDEELLIRANTATNSSVPQSSHVEEQRVSAEGEAASKEESRQEEILDDPLAGSDTGGIAREINPETEDHQKVEEAARRGRSLRTRKRNAVDIEENGETREPDAADEEVGQDDLVNDGLEEESRRPTPVVGEVEAETKNAVDAEIQEKPLARSKPGKSTAKSRSRRLRARKEAKLKADLEQKEDPEDADEQVLEPSKEEGMPTMVEDIDIQNEEEAEALEALGALADLEPPERDSPGTKECKTSARNQKRALAKLKAKDTLQGERLNSLATSSSFPISPKVDLLAKAAEEVDAAKAYESLTWKGAWKQKHIQRMEEVEAEEEAAQNEDMIEEYGPQVPLPMATRRPVRAIKIPRAPDRLETAGSKARDGELELVSPSPQRAGRGRGRWANHVKKGRGPRTGATALASDAPRGARRGNRGRGGGRWGQRATAPKVETPEGLCLDAFSSLLMAMDDRQISAAVIGATGRQSVCPRILDLPASKFPSFPAAFDNVWTYKVGPPPVPLFVPAS